LRGEWLPEVQDGLVPQTIWPHEEVGHTQEAKAELLENVTFASSDSVFETPKPTRLIQRMIHLAIGETVDSDDIILDFFAGSGTTAHAVMAQNFTDGGSRRFIMVQLPEPTGHDDFRTVADITKARIRSVIAKLDAEDSGRLDLVQSSSQHRGFRLFKLDSSNIRAWEPELDDIDGSLLASLDHLKDDRTEEDIFYELLLKLGLDLTIPIERRILAKKTVYSVAAGTLIACLAESIDRSEIEELALGIATWRAELDPAADTVVVFRDSAFADDVAKTNITAILEQHGIPIVRSL
jgi:adenine-specific DNA-methyltransferase